MWGSGRQTRSFLHGRDAARALAGLTACHACADPVNVGSGEEVSLRDIAGRILALTGNPGPVRFDASLPEGAVRKGCDPSRLHRILDGFQPEISLDDGLREMVATIVRRGGR